MEVKVSLSVLSFMSLQLAPSIARKKWCGGWWMVDDPRKKPSILSAMCFWPLF